MGRKKYFISSLGLLPFLLMLMGCAASLPPVPPPDATMKIAVVAISEGKVNQKIAGMLITALSKDGYFTVVERERVRKIIEEQQFQFSGIVDPKTAVSLGKLLDVKAIVRAEIAHRKIQNMAVVVGVVPIYSVTVTAQVISVADGKTIAAVSETGKSFTFGTPVEMTYGGEKKQDVVGVKRSEEDMFNAAIRDGVEKVTTSIIKAIYEKNKKFEIMDADTPPNRAIESLTGNVSDTNYFAARAKIYYAPFEVVWASAHKYFQKEGIAKSDRASGIIITAKYSSPKWQPDFQSQSFILVEKISDDSTKVTVKGFCYKYTMYHPPNQHLTGWKKLDPDFCSSISLKGIRKNIIRVMEEVKK